MNVQDWITRPCSNGNANHRLWTQHTCGFYPVLTYIAYGTYITSYEGDMPLALHATNIYTAFIAHTPFGCTQSFRPRL